MRIGQPVKRINTYEGARQYFSEAALRKETVFVSYSGKDGDVAAEMISALKRVFQTVFDYRDGASIVPGQPWLKEIFHTISISALGVPLLSNNYFASGNCEHELRAMVGRQDERKLQLVPVKLNAAEAGGKRMDLPPYLTDIQYVRYWTYQNHEEAVKQIVNAFYEGKIRRRPIDIPASPFTS